MNNNANGKAKNVVSRASKDVQDLAHTGGSSPPKSDERANQVLELLSEVDARLLQVLISGVKNGYAASGEKPDNSKGSCYTGAGGTS